MNGHGRPRSQFAHTFTAPGQLALVSGTGLVVALVGDGVLDVAASIGVAAPLAAIAWARFTKEPADATMCKAQPESGKLPNCNRSEGNP